MLADRISAIIIKNKKILLVSDIHNIHITPGGKVDYNETHEQALKRELMEELKVKLKSMKKYISYDIVNEVKKQKQTVYCYLTEIVGEPIPSTEIQGYGWFDVSNIPKVRSTIANNLIPKLLEDELL